MLLGPYQLGDTVDLRVQCRNSAGVPSAPDAAPTARFYKNGDSDSILSGISLPAQDRFGTTGLFLGKLLLDNRFATGRYFVKYDWLVSAVAGTDLQTFEIYAGGDARGAIISMHSYQTRGADHLVWSTDGGFIVTGRTPRV